MVRIDKDQWVKCVVTRVLYTCVDSERIEWKEELKYMQYKVTVQSRRAL